MSGRTFEQWAALCGYRQGTLACEHAQNGFTARQPEIDALRVEAERLWSDIDYWKGRAFTAEDRLCAFNPVIDGDAVMKEQK